jgi:hypothetical protein
MFRSETAGKKQKVCKCPRLRESLPVREGGREGGRDRLGETKRDRAHGIWDDARGVAQKKRRRWPTER